MMPVIFFLTSWTCHPSGKLYDDKLIREISVEEMYRSVSFLKPSKSPGTDGFSEEWCKSPREQLIPILQTSFNCTFREGDIPPFCREAAIFQK